MSSPVEADAPRIERWPTEIPLLLLVALAAAAMWALLALSIFGLFYAIVLGLFFFVTHVVLVTHIRGSAVRLGPTQFSELYQRVELLSQRAGLPTVPEAYLMESGGALNAFATRFLRSRMIVLYSDLLEACGDDEPARDMIIGHELGHLRAGHLNWMWLLMPGMFVPFLGSAYSRARELTCDRYGAALCGERGGAVRGLTILAAGRRHARDVDLESYVAQSKDLDTGWMTLGRWLSTYPPLCERVALVEPTLVADRRIATRGPLRAVAILGSLFVLPVVGGATAVAVLWNNFEASLEELAAMDDYDYDDYEESAPFEGDVEAATAQAEDDLETIAGVIEAHLENGGGTPEDWDAIEILWNRAHPDRDLPSDPFDGFVYGYEASETGFHLWSSGPDADSLTDDDITLEWSPSPRGDDSDRLRNEPLHGQARVREPLASYVMLRDRFGNETRIRAVEPSRRE